MDEMDKARVELDVDELFRAVENVDKYAQEQLVAFGLDAAEFLNELIGQFQFHLEDYYSEPVDPKEGDVIW